MPDNARPVSRLQAEVERELARGLDHFSIVTFGYDRSSDDPPPRLVIEWGHKQIAREKSRRKALGTIVIGSATTLLGAVSWPLLQMLAPWLK